MKTLTELMELADAYAEAVAQRTLVRRANTHADLKASLAEVFAENERLKTENLQIHTLMNLYNLGGWTDSLELMKERDSEKQVREQHAETILWQAEEIAKLIAERDAFKVDAESWRKYKERKDAYLNALSAAPQQKPQKLLLEHSGCGHGTQVEQVTVRLNRGDKVVLLMGPYTAATEAKK